jgi:hypothetical protein
MMVSEQPANRQHGSPDASGGRTVLGYPLADKLVIFLGIPAVALLIGLLLPPLARWILGLSSGLPLRPVFRFLGSVDTPREILINLAIWLVLGLIAARAALNDSTKVTVTDAGLHLGKDGRAQTIPRDDVAAVYLDGKKLVVLDRESRQLVRENHQAPKAALARAFEAHGYPWQDADPYADLYRRWVPNTPDLPPAANAVLTAREIALKKKAGQEIRELRDAVEKLGFVVRDDGARQYWRPLVRS